MKIDAVIQSYADCLYLWKSCRYKSRGKPLKGYILQRDGDVFKLTKRGYEVLHILPDNTITFPTPRMIGIAQSLSSNLHAVVPFFWNRVGTGRWRVSSILHANDFYPVGADAPAKGAYFWEYISKHGPEFYAGIRFNLLTGECLNRKPDKLKNINPEKRTEWLAKVKRFRRTVKAAIKLGGMDQAANTFYEGQYHWHEQLFQAMVTGISENKLSDEFIGLLGRECRRYKHSSYVMSRENIWAAFDSYYTSVSVRLREQFGVFNG